MTSQAGAATSPVVLRCAGLALLLSGWAIVLAALDLLKTPGARAGFVMAGVAVELLGATLVVRSHGVIHRKKT